MKLLTAEATRQCLPYPYLIDCLAAGLMDGITTPPRHYHQLGDNDDFLLLMPSWSTEGWIGTKLCGVFPDNPARGGNIVCEAYVLMERANGKIAVICEGGELTNRRTAAASALAARALARVDARTLLVMGTGAMAPYMAEAHCSVRDYEQVFVWGRDPSKAETVATQLRASGLPAVATDDAASAAAQADTISCATSASAPIVHGEWVKPGTHIDLVGSHSATAREVDTTLVRRARVFVDLRASAEREAGDLLIPVAEGVFILEAIEGDLADLAHSNGPRRRTDDDVTLFKSVGFAAEDLIAAVAATRSEAF